MSEGFKKFFKRSPKKDRATAPFQDAKKTPSFKNKSPLGIHVLSNPTDSCFDVLFIHGLGGHWRDTWRAKEAQGSWPEELLPSRLRFARILSYGYDAHITDWRRIVSENTITDHANNLLRDLSNHRDEGDTNHRPILFVTHSLGGLVCEDALSHSKNSPDEHIKQILACTKGIIFMGTPHAGTDALATWAKVLATSVGLIKQTNPQILEVLQRNSEILYRIQTDFHTMIRDRQKRNEPDIEIVCFFEELPIRGYGFVVPREAAALVTYQSTGLGYNHTEMTKFKDPEDPAFLAVSAELIRWSKPLRPAAGHNEAEKDRPQSASNPARSQTIPDFPYSRNSHFVGCEDILKSVDIRLQAKASVALCGIGGVGKTEIATEYCYRVWDKYPNISIFWVACDSLIKIELAFREIARIFDLGGHDDPDTDIVQLVSLHFQRGYAKHWLLVLDNADDVELLTKGKNALAKCIPAYRNGSIIITTKDRFVAQTLTGRAHDTIMIDRLSSKDALTLFRSKLPGDAKLEDAVELQILEILEHLPLGITQAAAYIDYSNITLCEYLLELTESEAGLLKILDEEHVDYRRGLDSPNSVLRAWKLSFEKIRSNYFQACQLLSVMAFLDRQNISRDLLQGLAESRHQLNTALGILQGFSLINAESSNGYFRMHRLVQLATRFWLFGKKTDYEALALKLVVANFCQDGCEDHIKQTLLIPHAKVVATYTFPDKDNTLILAKLQHSIASYDLRAGYYDAAAESSQGAYDKRLALCGKTHLDTLHSLGLLGVVKRYQGLYEEARLLLSKVIDDKTAVLGAEDLDTINSVSDLSEVLERQGEYDSSQSLAEQAQRIRSNRLGDDAPKTLHSLMQLALIARRQAKYKKAETLFREVLKGYEETLPNPHEATLKCAYALAGVLRESNQYDEAITLSEMVAKDRKVLLGKEHPQTLLAVNNLALGYRLKGQLERAEQLYRQVFKIHEECQRQDHPEALQVYQNLAVVLRDQAKYEEAEKIGRCTLAGRERVLGLDHLSTINTASDLAMTLKHLKAYPEAASLASRALEVRTRRLGETHTYSLETLFTVASIQRDTGHLTDAKALFQRVLDGRIKVLGSEHPATKETADVLATLHMDSR